jgi:hypothetical protein
MPFARNPTQPGELLAPLAFFDPMVKQSIT